MGNLISAKNDVIFKMLFRNKDLLSSFLSAALNIPLESFVDLSIRSSEFPPVLFDGKLSRMDIFLQTKDKNINIEMQNSKIPDYKERVLYYWSKMFSDSLKKGQYYEELNQSISINILDYNMFDCKEYHSAFSVIENTRHELFCDKLSLHFFELPKISSVPNKNNLQQLWLQVINATSEEELNMLNETNIPIIQQSIKSIYSLNADEKIRALAWEREKAERDYYSDVGHAKAEGIEIGTAKGIEIITRKMRAHGMSDEEINAILNSDK